MNVLTVRTDKPEAEIGIYKDSTRQSYRTWQAHRELSATLLNEVEALLRGQQLSWQDIDGIVFYKGPGSFTGLRIGASFVNALGSAEGTVIVQENGDTWIDAGIARLLSGANESAAPLYGEPARTSQQRK